MNPIVVAFSMTMFVILNLHSEDQSLPSNLASLMNAERSFARTCSEKGIRQSFLDFLADSSILFRPHPVNGRQFLLGRPVPATLPPVRLAWAPIFAEVSEAGDFGYTTGPFELSELSSKKEPTHYGAFFSIWKKQSNGVWKVILDAGIQTSAPTAPLGAPFTLPPTVKRERPIDAKGNLKAGKESLLDAERDFARVSISSSSFDAYASRICNCARFHRNGELPVVGKDSIVAFLKRKPWEAHCKVIAADISKSGDLGFTYGRYQLKESRTKSEIGQDGYFVRVWRRNPQNKWVIVFETFQPIPVPQ
jgi:ketosteroid isomerase-like protein